MTYADGSVYEGLWKNDLREDVVTDDDWTDDEWDDF
jgi:hypothetical protein